MQASNSENAFIKGEFVIERFPGKGGWYYVALPGIKTAQNQPFGWRVVKGSIDNYNFEQYHLMPMGNGSLFLPIKASVRKEIKKTVGDRVSITLFEDEGIPAIPDYLKDSLSFEPVLWKEFEAQTTAFKRAWIKKIEDAKTEDGKSKRILDLIQTLEKK